MRQKEREYLMQLAQLTSKRSTAVRLQVGAVVTDIKGDIVATGYNGTIRNFHTNTCEHTIDGNIVTDDRITIHAEQNVITHAARRGIGIDGGYAVITHSPCAKCCSLLIQCGIAEIIYKEEHRTFEETADLFGKYVKLTKFGV